MDDLTERLRALNTSIQIPNTELLSLETLKSRMQPETQKVSFSIIRNAAALVFIVVLANVSAMVWSGKKDANTAKTNQTNTYMQTYNLSIY